MFQKITQLVLKTRKLYQEFNKILNNGILLYKEAIAAIKSQCAKYLLPLKWIEQEEFENLREFQKHEE
jgi:hypothetical protein